MSRDLHLQRALVLSALSILVSGLAGGTAVAIGLATSRLSLLGFGFDAVVDSVASIVLFWRFRIEATHPHHAERAERAAELVVGAVLVVLALYVGGSAALALAFGSHPERTTVGLAISVASLVVLPPLAVAKGRVARDLRSGSLRADSILTGVAALLALVSLVSYALTEMFRFEWADAVGGLAVAAVLLREGSSAFRGGGLSG